MHVHEEEEREKDSQQPVVDGFVHVYVRHPASFHNHEGHEVPKVKVAAIFGLGSLHLHLGIKIAVPYLGGIDGELGGGERVGVCK